MIQDISKINISTKVQVTSK